MSWSCTIRLANYDWICIMPEPVSPTGEASNFIAISRASICDTSFSCIDEVQICGSKVTINHSLCCTSDIWKLTLAINVLNCWSKSQTDSIGSCLIYLMSVMHCDSDFNILNSSINHSQISLSVFRTTPTDTMEIFVYQSSAWPWIAVIICAFCAFFTKNPIFFWVLQPLSIEYSELNVSSSHCIDYCCIDCWYSRNKIWTSWTSFSIIYSASTIHIYRNTWRQVSRSYLWYCRRVVYTFLFWSFSRLFKVFVTFWYWLIYLFLVTRAFF